MLSSMQGGTVDGATMNTNLLVGIIKDAGLVDLPYLFDNEQEAYAVLDGPFGKKIHSQPEPKGLVGLGVLRHGLLQPAQQHASDQEDRRRQGPQDARYRDAGDDRHVQGLGFERRAAAYAELFSALESRIVDGGGQPPLNMIYGKIGEVSKFYTNRYSYTPVSLLMSKKTMDKLTADEKKVIADASKEATD